MTVPPVNSTDRFKPRETKKNTANTKAVREITLSTNTWRMNGMSFLMRKSSMLRSRLLAQLARSA